MKKRIIIFAIILIAVTCSLFAYTIEYRLLCNDASLNEEIERFYSYSIYEDTQFNLDWPYYQLISKDTSNSNYSGSFSVNCLAGSEFGFSIKKLYEQHNYESFVNDFIVEYDPNNVTLLTKTVSKEVVSPTKIKAMIKGYNEVFFKANPVLTNTKAYITIIGDASSSYYNFETVVAVDIKTAANSPNLWYLHTNDSISKKSSWDYNLYYYETPLESGMSFTPLALEEFSLYPSSAINRIGYVKDSDLYVVKYDSAYVTCNGINTTETNNYKKLYGIQENSSEKIVVVNGKNGIKFTRNGVIETSYKTSSIEVVPYPFFMDSNRSVKLSLNVGGWKKVEMAKDETTRLYGAYPNEFVVSKNNVDIKTRGLTVGDNLITVSWRTFNTTYHQYEYYLETLNYKNSISANSNYGTTLGYNLSDGVRFALNLSSSAFRHEDYLNNEEVKIRLHVLDVTDRVDYYYDFEYPLEDLEPNFWSISDFTTATNGDVNMGTLVDTTVYFDFKVKSTTPQDQFDSGYIVIYDNTRTKVYSAYFELRRSNDATSGTLSYGWGKNTLFYSLNNSFTPKSTGTYYVDIYGWNYYGNYNVGKYSTTFKVSK